MSQCYDALWVDHTLLDLHANGVKTNLLNLLHESSKSATIRIKTPVGTTDSKDISDQVMQGETVSSIMCTSTIDKIAKDNKVEEFKYRDAVKIPKLSFVDDIFDVHHCKEMTKKMNQYTNEEISKRKLVLSEDKCKRMHVESRAVKSDNVCDELTIDKWVVEKTEKEGKTILEDKYDNKIKIKTVENLKYLGDLVMDSGSVKMNIQNRISKGQAIINDITQILEGIYFGEFHFEAFLMMRNSLFLSVITHNLEVSNLPPKEIKSLESLDYQLIRRALSVNSKQSPIIMMLELGIVSVKYILMKNRMMYLFHLLNSPIESICNQVFLEQIKNPLKQDWATCVKSDMISLKLELSFDQIHFFSNRKFKVLVSDLCKKACFNELLEKTFSLE